MFGNYRAVFRAPGTAAFCGAGFIMRLPIGLYPIGLVLLTSLKSGHYGFGGALAAVYTGGTAIGNPILGRLIDRHGQSRVLRPAVTVHVLAAALLIVLAQLNCPDATLLAPAFLIGLAYPAAGSLTRARWSHVFTGPQLTAAYSLESTLDEIIFVVGPPIVTVIATQASPLIGLILAAVLVAWGGYWLASMRATEPAPHPHQDGVARVSAIRAPGMKLLLFATLGAGAFFASAEVTMVAFCGQHGVQGAGGFVLAGMALGSALSGLLYGARRWRTDVIERFRIQSAIFGVLPLLFLLAVNIPVLAVCAFLVGCGVAPTLITVYGVIERLVPAGAITEGFSWLTTGLGVGYGISSAVAGHIADAYGARTAFVIAYGAGLLMAVTALFVHRTLRNSRPSASQAVPAPAR
jgi:MFS family permease